MLLILRSRRPRSPPVPGYSLPAGEFLVCGGGKQREAVPAKGHAGRALPCHIQRLGLSFTPLGAASGASCILSPRRHIPPVSLEWELSWSWDVLGLVKRNCFALPRCLAPEGDRGLPPHGSSSASCDRTAEKVPAAPPGPKAARPGGCGSTLSSLGISLLRSI